MADPTPDTIELWGGALCLDLANSSDWDDDRLPVDPEHNDVLRSPSMLDAWSRRLGLLDAPAFDVEELDRIRDLRASLHRLFSAVAEAREPEPADLLTLHECLAEASGVGELAPGAAAWSWTWPEDEPRGASAAGCSSIAADGAAGARWRPVGAARTCDGCTPAARLPERTRVYTRARSSGSLVRAGRVAPPPGAGEPRVRLVDRLLRL